MAADLFEVIETGAGAPQQLYGVEDGSHRFCGGCRFKYLRGRKQEGDWELKDACACVSCDRCCGRSRRQVLWMVQRCCGWSSNARNCSLCKWLPVCRVVCRVGFPASAAGPVLSCTTWSPTVFVLKQSVSQLANMQQYSPAVRNTGSFMCSRSIKPHERPGSWSVSSGLV